MECQEVLNITKIHQTSYKLIMTYELRSIEDEMYMYIAGTSTKGKKTVLIYHKNFRK
jgi:hypothetical protein